MPKICEFKDCKTQASFGYEGGKAIFCKKHIKENMINIANFSRKSISVNNLQNKTIGNHIYVCEYENCNIYPTFNYIGQFPRFCVNHKLVDMIDVHSKKCCFDNCTSRPSYNYIGQPAKYCKEHKLDSMVDVNSRKCKFNNCNKQPNYGILGCKPEYCKEHKLNDMIDIRNKTCQFDGCNKQPNYGFLGEKAKYCTSHKESGMIDLSNKRCEFQGCEKLPVFGYDGEKARYCFSHKEDEMINVSHKKCEFVGCKKQPGYGLPNCKPQFCVEHKTNDMINLIVKLCEFIGCVKQPVYGYDIPKFCKEHKENGMTNVKDKLCIYDGCKTRANYNIIGSKPEYCAKHKNKDMVLNPTKKCSECNNLAIYNRMRCELHKNEDDITTEGKCVLCGLLNLLDKDNKCKYCVPTLTKLSKQNSLMTYLNSKGLHGSSTDKVVDNGICNNSRPDRIYDFIDKIIILECDENQHSGRNCLCEQTRMINIGQSFGGVPVYFIRWNPDKYKSIKTNESITKRHKLCANLIDDIKENKYKSLPLALISAIYLYYDNFVNISSESWIILQEINTEK